ncbi:hypothetical protein VNO78_22998 [Psophocarpus tetragonolobus]|uniref:Uncharacterized protein n=1 Tax=Psophocarpus tetragonolobus TaxID=3891 RepID=A0AAN9S2J0_PSOTE
MEGWGFCTWQGVGGQGQDQCRVQATMVKTCKSKGIANPHVRVRNNTVGWGLPDLVASLRLLHAIKSDNDTLHIFCPFPLSTVTITITITTNIITIITLNPELFILSFSLSTPFCRVPLHYLYATHNTNHHQSMLLTYCLL